MKQYDINIDRKLKPIKTPMKGNEIQTEKGGDYTGRCYKCGSTNLWDDNLTYGCRSCGMIKIVS
jgi:hypothetical protein